ncbi:hypothetical protein J6590_088133 [Homalodisca vitripennis]|nr:hypothetical protein J6590_088133 [Homalodisca vitripennis]
MENSTKEELTTMGHLTNRISVCYRQHYRQLQTILELISETQDSPWSPVIKVPCYVVGVIYDINSW